MHSWITGPEFWLVVSKAFIILWILISSEYNPLENRRLGINKKIWHKYVKAWNFTWKVFITLEVKNHYDSFAGLYYGVFYKLECFFSKVLILYTFGKVIENWAKNNEIVGYENWLVTSYSRSKVQINLEKITILITVCLGNVPGFCCIKNSFYIKCIWKKTNLPIHFIKNVFKAQKIVLHYLVY